MFLSDMVRFNFEYNSFRSYKCQLILQWMVKFAQIFSFIYWMYGFINRCNIKIVCICWIYIENAISWSKSDHIQWCALSWRFNTFWIMMMIIIACICLWVSIYQLRMTQQHHTFTLQCWIFDFEIAEILCFWFLQQIIYIMIFDPSTKIIFVQMSMQNWMFQFKLQIFSFQFRFHLKKNRDWTHYDIPVE